MPSLTPTHRSEEATGIAFSDGILSGVLTLIPSSATVFWAMKNSPKFVRSTNLQSRTALVIMPPLLAFGITSETKLNHKMKEMAAEMEHGRATEEWAEIHRSKLKRETQALAVAPHQGGMTSLDESQRALAVGVTDRVKDMSKEEAEKQLMNLYRESVEKSGVRIIPGTNLGPHHRLSNFFTENPFKILASVAVPTVLYIFKGRNDKNHLRLQSKIMQTRVIGQASVVVMLLGLMGFKDYMDKNGKFISEADADGKVRQMILMREQLTERLAMDKERRAERDQVLRRAYKSGRHESDLERLGHKKSELRKLEFLKEDLTDERVEEVLMDAEESLSENKSAKKKKGKDRIKKPDQDDVAVGRSLEVVTVVGQ